MYVKFRFGKCFFVTAGVSANLHPWEGYDFGAGVFGGVGIQHVFRQCKIYLSPLIQYNLFTKENAASDNIRQFGIKIGIDFLIANKRVNKNK
jgi:hypothetical protein